MKRRIDYPDDESTYAQLMNTLADHGRHVRHDEQRQAAVTAYRAEQLAGQLTNEAFDRFDLEHRRQRRSLAAEIGIAHGTVNERISRVRPAVPELLVTACAEEMGMGARPGLIRPGLEAIASKKAAGWSVEDITEWMAAHFPETGFADRDTITRLYNRL